MKQSAREYVSDLQLDDWVQKFFFVFSQKKVLRETMKFCDVSVIVIIFWHTNTNVVVVVVSWWIWWVFPFLGIYPEDSSKIFESFFSYFHAFPVSFQLTFRSLTFYTRILFKKFQIFTSGLFTHNFYNFIHYYTPL